MIANNINKLLLFAYIIIAFSIKHFGVFMPYIINTNYSYCYRSYKKIAKNLKKSNIAGIVIKTLDKFEIIPIMKKIIGVTMIDNTVYFIDSDGHFFQSEEESFKDYITISGNPQFWSIYYKEFENYPEILTKVYHVHIYHYRIDVYLLPGILVKLNRSIKDLDEFYSIHERYFTKKNFYIDLRNTKKVGYAPYDLNISEFVE